MKKHLPLIALAALFAAPAAPAAEVTAPDAPVKLDLYGVILANSYWNSSGVVGSDVPLWTVSGTDPRAGDKELGMTARQSRFGLRLTAPDVGSAKLNAVLELDFFGSLPNGGQKASFGQARVRLANLKLDWKNASFTAGQDWIILAPLNPTTLGHFAVVGLAASGNVWLRYPQLRMEVTGKRGEAKLGLTAGLLRPVGGSDPSEAGALIDTAGAGERSGFPFVQARAFYARPMRGKTLGVGLSAHYGKESYKFGTTAITKDEATTWAAAADFQAPLGDALSVQGEIFTGTNLDSFQGGVNQGVATNDALATATAIDAKGGWVQVSFAPPGHKKLSFHLAYGIDDPDDNALKAGQRAKNSTLMASVFYKPTANFQWALEYSRLNTEYRLGQTNDASILNLAFAFSF